MRFEDLSFFVVDNSNFRLFLIQTFHMTLEDFEFSIFSWMVFFCHVLELDRPSSHLLVRNSQDSMQNIYFCVSQKTENLLLRAEMTDL